MRTIKFRGKCAKGSRYAGEWAYGSCVQCEKSDDVLITAAINDRCSCTYHVDPDTVGQYTGLTDKNGKKIYEGDIISSKKHPQIKHLIFYNEKQGKFMAGLYGNTNIYDFGVCGVDFPAWMAEKEVVGNIHDNPELLEKGGKK